MPSPIPAPFVNGARHEGNSAEINFLGRIYIGLTSINYSDKVEPQVVKGFHPEALGYTRGDNEAEGDIEFYLEEFIQLVADLGDGWREAIGTAQVTHAENGLSTTIDEIIGIRLAGVEAAVKAGGDAQTRKIGFKALKIKWGGRENYIKPLAGVPA